MVVNNCICGLLQLNLPLALVGGHGRRLEHLLTQRLNLRGTQLVLVHLVVKCFKKSMSIILLVS